ncbi:MAG: hypothetical protein LIP10_00785 [Clostridiales bacterium]|nr:hypothetical protein [Clostridiales bacterium]
MKREEELTDPFLTGSVSSDTECTGLMPTPPASEAEMESYEELYPFSPAQTVVPSLQSHGKIKKDFTKSRQTDS